MVTAASLRRLFADEVRGQFCRPIEITAGVGDDCALGIRQGRITSFQIVEQSANPAIARRRMLYLRQHRVLRRALLGGAGRKIHLFVPTQQFTNRAQAVRALHPSNQFADRGLNCHPRDLPPSQSGRERDVVERGEH
jgi:hypothetical protein